MENKPNIILINCDDLGYGDLACYGSEKHDTPNLDRLAEGGTRFTDFYMASPVCSPSRGAMLTGCYPPRIGFASFDGDIVLFPGHDLGLNPSEITIARLLKDAGYSTMMVGKWHCGDQPEFLPTSHGFDDYYGIPFSNDMGRMVRRESAPPLPLMSGADVIQEQPDQTAITERYTEKSVSFIRKNKDRPFFLYLAHMHVHLPLYAAAPFVEKSRAGDYGACVMAIDWSTGVLVDELKRQGLYENTLILFTSDNGSRNDFGGNNGKLRGTKSTTWEGGLRVPLIAHWPGKIKPSVCGELVTSMDLYPTLASIGGAEIPRDRIIDGIDISGLLLGKTEKSPRDTFFYYMADKLEAVRRGKYKLFVSRGPGGKVLLPWQEQALAESGQSVENQTEDGKLVIPENKAVYELYDLSVDIGETNNIYDQRPDIVAELTKLIEECRTDLGDAVAGVKGTHARPAGRVSNPRPLTEYNEDHPYIIALYDRDEIG